MGVSEGQTCSFIINSLDLHLLTIAALYIYLFFQHLKAHLYLRVIGANVHYLCVRFVHKSNWFFIIVYLWVFTFLVHELIPNISPCYSSFSLLSFHPHYFSLLSFSSFETRSYKDWGPTWPQSHNPPSSSLCLLSAGTAKCCHAQQAWFIPLDLNLYWWLVFQTMLIVILQT